MLNDIVQTGLHVSIKWADRAPVDELNKRTTILKEQHRALQAIIEEWNAVAQQSVGLSVGANMKIDYLRAYQSALATDVKILQDELAKR